MNQLTTAKVALSLSGIVVWAYGYRTGQQVLTWIGIGLLAVALILRFVGRGGGNAKP